MSFKRTYSEIQECSRHTNEKDQIYVKLLSHPLSISLVYLLRNTRVTPNLITSVSFIFSLLGVYTLLRIEDYVGLVLAWLFFHLALIFDSADGQMARWKKNGTSFGAYYDIFTDFLEQRLLVVVLAIRLSYEHEDALLWGLICLAILSLKTMQPHMKKKAILRHGDSLGESEKKKGHPLKVAIGKLQIALDGHYLYLAIALLGNRPIWFFYIISVWFGILIVKRFLMEFFAR